MHTLGIASYFDDIFISSDYSVKKPDVRFFEELINKHQIDVTKAIMIGNDAKSDIFGAKNGIYIISFWNNQKITGGIHTVAFNYKNGLYTVYNDSDNNTKSKSYRSLTAIYSGGRFIVGYYLS